MSELLSVIVDTLDKHHGYDLEVLDFTGVSIYFFLLHTASFGSRKRRLNRSFYCEMPLWAGHRTAQGASG